MISIIVVLLTVVGVVNSALDAEQTAAAPQETLVESVEDPIPVVEDPVEVIPAEPEEEEPVLPEDAWQEPGVPVEGVLYAPGGPWVPGTTMMLSTHYPVAGEEFHVSNCTVAFSFRDSAGQAYAVTAGHCGKVGDLVWPTDGETIDDYAVEAGRVIYTDLGTGSEAVNDVGIIKITEPPRTMGFAGDASQQPILAGGTRFNHISNLPREVCQIGGRTGVTCGANGGLQRQYLITSSQEQILTQGRTAHLCASRGDSGGPVVGDIGGHSVVLGLLSGARSEIGPDGDCSPETSAGATVAYTPMPVILNVVRSVIPDAVFTEFAPAAA